MTKLCFANQNLVRLRLPAAPHAPERLGARVLLGLMHNSGSALWGFRPHHRIIATHFFFPSRLFPWDSLLFVVW